MRASVSAPSASAGAKSTSARGLPRSASSAGDVSPSRRSSSSDERGGASAAGAGGGSAPAGDQVYYMASALPPRLREALRGPLRQEEARIQRHAKAKKKSKVSPGPQGKRKCPRGKKYNVKKRKCVKRKGKGQTGVRGHKK